VELGVGRYQPHFAAEVLDNGYGDCTDKQTLLASLLTSAGFKVYPVLISSQRDIDPDVPSPGQFDHVIGVVAVGDKNIWLDTTPEVAPFGFLMAPLRGKRGLLVRSDSASLEVTLENPDFKSSHIFQMKAKLDDSGTLRGEAEYTIAGDDFEVLLRSLFRSTPMPQWKDLAQRISYGYGFGGEVSEVHATPPEDLSQPFHLSYKYTRKSYGDWDNRRISAPLPAAYLPDIKEGTKTPSAPLWFGVPGEIQFHSTVELPKSYTLQLPPTVSTKEDFGQYDGEYSLQDGVLTTDRRLVLFVSELPVTGYPNYKEFRKQIVDDRERMIQLSSTSAPRPSSATEAANSDPSSMAEIGRAVWSLPSSSGCSAIRK
jgi:hypothetical protein